MFSLVFKFSLEYSFIMRLPGEHIITPKWEAIFAPLHPPRDHPLPKIPLRAYIATRDPSSDFRQNVI